MGASINSDIIDSMEEMIERKNSISMKDTNYSITPVIVTSLLAFITGFLCVVTTYWAFADSNVTVIIAGIWMFALLALDICTVIADLKLYLFYPTGH